MSSSSSLKACTMLAACSSPRAAISCMPEAPGTRRTPARVVTMISCKVFSPLKKWLRLCSQRLPRAICALARPRSASSNMTRSPISCSATARFTDTVVLPTPPLPLAMPITCVRESLFMKSFRQTFFGDLAAPCTDPKRPPHQAQSPGRLHGAGSSPATPAAGPRSSLSGLPD